MFNKLFIPVHIMVGISADKSNELIAFNFFVRLSDYLLRLCGKKLSDHRGG